jgi:hypothetical protein
MLREPDGKRSLERPVVDGVTILKLFIENEYKDNMFSVIFRANAEF